MKLRELIRETAQRLSRAKLHYGHGTDNARDEAAFLVLRGLQLAFDADLDQEVDAARIAALVERRIRERLPTAYLLREAWLDGLAFHVDRRVIIPRSHIAFLFPKLTIRPHRILDLCTGSGCLAILAARAFPDARVDASDISAAALALAARNVARHRMEKRVRLVRSDLFAKIDRAYDLILSNPPYVSTPSMRRLPREYRYEPGIALAGGRDGLDLVARILAGARERLTSRGLLVCEVGGSGMALERRFPAIGFAWLRPEVFVLAKTALAGQSAPRRARGG
ncbi:MAG TPA: 50S ribosomal protein L3 N(5)-glutamine methyltransferase [Burkholderiales bacterium]|nr:50S ribosomal protein L3 N(5)-glutamine methyltransferase [Burkholderiales bacterium]